MRLLTVEILIAIAEVVPKEQQSSHGVLLAALRSLFEDKSVEGPVHGGRSI